MRHAAKIETSIRLKQILNLLLDGRKWSNFALMEVTKLVAVGSAISEINAPINKEYLIKKEIERVKHIQDSKGHFYQVIFMRKIESELEPILDTPTTNRVPQLPSFPDLIGESRKAWDDWSHLLDEQPIIQEELF